MKEMKEQESVDSENILSAEKVDESITTVSYVRLITINMLCDLENKFKLH